MEEEREAGTRPLHQTPKQRRLQPCVGGGRGRWVGRWADARDGEEGCGQGRRGGGCWGLASSGPPTAPRPGCWLPLVNPAPLLPAPAPIPPLAAAATAAGGLTPRRRHRQAGAGRPRLAVTAAAVGHTGECGCGRPGPVSGRGQGGRRRGRGRARRLRSACSPPPPSLTPRGGSCRFVTADPQQRVVPLGPPRRPSRACTRPARRRPVTGEHPQLKTFFSAHTALSGFRGLMHAEATDRKAQKIHHNEEEYKARQWILDFFLSLWPWSSLGV